MINLRYHIVSIAAVFLALGIGVLMGTTVIKEGVVKTLRADITREENRSDRLEADNDSLRQQVSLWRGFGDETVPLVTAGRLSGQTVVFVGQPGASADLIGTLERTVTSAGGRTAGRLLLTDKWALRDEAAREQLALAIGGRTEGPEEMLEAAAARLAQRLQSASATDAQGDLIAALDRSEFVRLGGVRGAFPPRGALIVVVGASAEKKVPGEDAFFVPFLQALHTGRGVAVIEPLGTKNSLVQAVRRDRDMVAAITTVDHADTVVGRVAFVYALRALAAGSRAPHYGTADGASAAVPDLT